MGRPRERGIEEVDESDHWLGKRVVSVFEPPTRVSDLASLSAPQGAELLTNVLLGESRGPDRFNRI